MKCIGCGKNLKYLAVEIKKKIYCSDCSLEYYNKPLK